MSNWNYYQLYYHITWATKGRLPMINSQLRQPLHNYLRGKIIDMGGLMFVIGGVADHVHICLSIPPQVAIAKFIGQLKGASSHWMNHIGNPGGAFGWQDGYGVFSVSKELLDRTISYIGNQEKHHQEKMVYQDWEI
jgi:putative transposase